MLLIMPAALMAQAPQKIAHINSQEIIFGMPETKAMQQELEKLQKSYEDTLVGMREELNKKYEDYIAKKDSTPEALRLRMEQEIEDINKRIADLMQVAEQDLLKKQQELLTPIQAKVIDAIKKVGDENQFAYIIEVQVSPYVGSAAVDATPLVKAKLGI